MTRSHLISFSVSLFFLSGCATPGGHTLLGSAIGAAAGLAMGFVADAGPQGRGRAQNVFAGMALGTLLGGGTGYLVEQAKNPSTQSKEADHKALPPELTERRESGQPLLIPPRVDGNFIDDQIRGNTFIPGHLEFQIKEPAKWTR